MYNFYYSIHNIRLKLIAKHTQTHFAHWIRPIFVSYFSNFVFFSLVKWHRYIYTHTYYFFFHFVNFVFYCFFSSIKKINARESHSSNNFMMKKLLTRVLILLHDYTYTTISVAIRLGNGNKPQKYCMWCYVCHFEM